jgi:hypothetical protein
MPNIEGRPPMTSTEWQPPKSHKRPGVGNRHTAPHARGHPCRTPGCTRKVASGYGIRCPACEAADRRHGHPLQTTVEVRELAPYVRTVRRIIKRNKDHVNFSIVYERWKVSVVVCREIEEQGRREGVHVRWRRQAAALIIEISEAVEASRLFELVAAMYLLAHMRPERFKGDTAFAAELLHVVRREAKAGRKFCNGPNRSTVTYRIFSKRARDLAARFLTEPLGAPALTLALAEERRLNEAAAKANDYREAMDRIV